MGENRMGINIVTEWLLFMGESETAYTPETMPIDPMEYDQYQTPVNEPELAQRDEWQRSKLERMLYIPLRDEEGRFILNSNNEIQYWTPYRDIAAALTLLGHLEGTTNFTWGHAMGDYYDKENTIYEVLMAKYEQDPVASMVLEAWLKIIRRQCIGDAMEGWRAGFAVKLGGGDKMIRMLTGDLAPQGRRGFR